MHHLERLCGATPQNFPEDKTTNDFRTQHARDGLGLHHTAPDHQPHVSSDAEFLEVQHKKSRARNAGLNCSRARDLALTELRSATSLLQTRLLAFHFARIAGE
jgi:hypothetical protein